MRVDPLSTAIGVQISEVDVSASVPEDTLQALKALMDLHGLLLFREQADYLVERGYLKFVDNPDHLRAKRLIPTKKGVRTYELANRDSATWIDRVVKGLDAAQFDVTISLLRELRHRLEADVRR